MARRTPRNTRRHRRATVRILVDYQVRGAIHCDYATTLGAGGMFLQTELPLGRGELVKVRFRVPDGELLHELEAKVTWRQATAAAAFGPRYGLRAASFAGKLWVLGGRDAAGSYSQSQIWSSADGATWTLETDNAAFGGTGNFQIAEFQGQLWKTGGRDDAVYRSADGVNWVLVTDSAPFGARQQHTSVAFDDKLWVLGGNNNDNVYLDLSDAWYSEDGASWVRAAADAGYEPITAHSSVVYGGRMWVIAGGGGFGSSYVSSAVYSLDY